MACKWKAGSKLKTNAGVKAICPGIVQENAMSSHSIERTEAPVLASIPFRLLTWMLSTATMAAASVFFDALALSDMLAASALLALACAIPFQRDAAVEMAISQIMRYQALEGSSTKHR
jgi:hypothetical protein